MDETFLAALQGMQIVCAEWFQLFYLGENLIEVVDNNLSFARDLGNLYGRPLQRPAFFRSSAFQQFADLDPIVIGFRIVPS